jgi:ribulose-phosphate 3-epimerase
VIEGGVKLAPSILDADFARLADQVINPATPAIVLEEILPDLDLVLVMTIDPGFGHQHFLHTALPKIRRVRQMIEQIIPATN